jgi:hypothetical protein
LEKPERLGIDGRIMFNWLLKKEEGRIWTGYLRFRLGTNGRIRSLLLWDVKHRRLVVSYRHFGKTYRALEDG